MGDMAEYYREQEMYSEFKSDMQMMSEARKLKIAYESKKLEWTTLDKRKILVHEMSETHVSNTKNMLERIVLKDRLDSAWIDIFKLELVKRQTV